jgi:integrase
MSVASLAQLGMRSLAVVSVPLLAEYAATWLESIKGLVRPRTYGGYVYRLERHVLPKLGQRRLDEISIDDVLALIGDLRERGYSGWSIRSIFTPLSRVFSDAVRRDVIAASPLSKLDRTERPSVWKREQRVLNSEEIGRLLEAAPSRYRTLVATGILTGLRQSELLGAPLAGCRLRGGDHPRTSRARPGGATMSRRRRNTPCVTSSSCQR